jgi:glyoxylase-like metal-dependent hydrolase (beta-lactamase superfamily II)
MLFAVASVALNTTSLMAQEESNVEVSQLTERLYLLTTNQGAYTTHTIASVGDDGVLLVDTQAEGYAEELKQKVDAFGRGNPVYIINTHRHVEHLGGNAIFGETPIVIAHELVPKKLRSGSFLFEEYPDATLPDITLADSLSLYFNGERIRIIALAGSHDDNEIIVHFTESKVVHLSSLVNGFNFPSVDSDGDALKFAELVAKASELLPSDVTIVSGHNDTGTWEDLRTYHVMLVETAEVVRLSLAAGQDLETLQKDSVLKAWAHYAGSYVSTDEWIEYLVTALAPDDEPEKKDIYEPLYYAMKDGGAEAAVKRYFELKDDDAYEITEFELLIIGDKLLKKGRIPEAIEFLSLNLQEYPSGKYAYYGHYDLALAYQKQGDKAAAIEHCEKALELNAEFQGAAQLLEELNEM